MSIEETIRDFLLRELLYAEPGTTLDLDENLFKRRAIDSIGLLRVVGFLESTYDIELIDDDLAPGNLETVGSHRGAGPPQARREGRVGSMGSFDDLALDLARLRRYGRERNWLGWLLLIVSTEELWVIVTYRLARWSLFECRVPVVRQLLSFIFRAHLRLLRVLLHVWIAPQASIGGGLYINHFGTIWVNPSAVMGRFCNLHQGVTIGQGGRGATFGVPRLGDRVNLGPYATVLGRVTIGNDVLIGANSLVVQDIPDHAVAIGVPARVISLQGSGIPEDPTQPVAPDETIAPPPVARGD